MNVCCTVVCYVVLCSAIAVLLCIWKAFLYTLDICLLSSAALCCAEQACARAELDATGNTLFAERGVAAREAKRRLDFSQRQRNLVCSICRQGSQIRFNGAMVGGVEGGVQTLQLKHTFERG